MKISLEQVDILLAAVKEAGQIAIDLKAKGLVIDKKSDGSVVTNADKFIDEFLVNTIKDKLKNDDIILSEEDIGHGNIYPDIKEGEAFWSIDPIDSTKSYVNGGEYYTINVAYVDGNNKPVIGIIYAPHTKTLWYGICGVGAYKQVGDNPVQQIYTRTLGKERVLISSEEQITPEETLKLLGITKEIKLPSSIKFCMLAEGEVDYYCRQRNKACDWDITPGHALIVAAGGEVEFSTPFENFKYGVAPYLAPALIARGQPRNG